jgi:Flp pilus assembly secretin CpaC
MLGVVVICSLVQAVFAEDGKEPGDLVEIRAKIHKKSPDGTSTVISEPTLILTLGKWGEVENFSEILIPKGWSNLSIPEEIAGSVSVENPGEPSAKFERNGKKLVVPPQPTELEERKYGWKVEFRPRLLSSGRVAVDCRVNHTAFLGFINESNRVVLEKKGVLGGKGKEILIDANSRTESQFGTREQEVTFSPTESGHVAEVDSEAVSPEGFDWTSVPQLQVQLSAKRLEKLEAKRTKLRNPVVYLTTRFIEISDEENHPSNVGEYLKPRVLTDPEFQVLIRALNQKKGVDLLSAPSVVTPSGKTAKIEVVRETIYPTEYEPAEIPTEEDDGFPATPANPTVFETKPTGVSAQLTPRILSDGRIELTFEPLTTELKEFVNYGKPIMLLDLNRPVERKRIVVTENRIETPHFENRRSKTTVRLNDGDTLFFGGITREDIQDVKDKVPVLGDLPVVGRLARNQFELHIRRNLYFAVKVELMEKE